MSKKSSKNCQKWVKKIGKKWFFLKTAKNCQKIIKKLSKISQKFGKNDRKNNNLKNDVKIVKKCR